MTRRAEEAHQGRFDSPGPAGPETGVGPESAGSPGERRRRVLVLVAVVVVAVAVVDRVVLRPVAGLWRATSARLSARQAELAAARELIKRGDSLRDRYQTLARYVEEEPGTRESNFLALLHAAAERAGVEIASEKPVRNWRGGRRPGSIRHAETVVSLTFTSSLEALVRLLTELAAGGEPVRVRSVRIVSLDPAGRSLEVALRLSTVILPTGREGASGGPGSGPPGRGSESILLATGAEPPGARLQTPAVAAAEALYQRYRVIVERNVFSRFARTARAAPSPAAESEEPPGALRPPAGAGYVLTGVVVGGEVPVALVEETANGRTRLYRLGAETPAGPLEAVRMEGVVLGEAGSRRYIRVGYTLSGEPSEKLSRLTTTLQWESEGRGEEAARPPVRAEGREGGRLPGRGFRRWSREEILRRLRERRRRELSAMGDAGEEAPAGPGR